jgi:hypothetical protein
LFDDVDRPFLLDRDHGADRASVSDVIARRCRRRRRGDHAKRLLGALGGVVDSDLGAFLKGGGRMLAMPLPLR